MTALDKILALSDIEKVNLGLRYTPREIFQQPETWMKSVDILQKMSKNLTGFIGELLNDPDTRIILSGAGTSEFIGDASEGLLRRTLEIDTDSRATTDIITNSKDIFINKCKHLLISFARSGNSPESIGTWKIASTIPKTRQLVITCNSEGILARAGMNDPDTIVIILPKETHDKSLVMTSSFTNMLVAVLGIPYLKDLTQYKKDISLAADAGRKIFKQADLIKSFAEKGWKRGIYLGSGPLRGTAREAHLKMLESTNGQIMTRFDSFLGLRHGPQVSIDKDSFVVAMLSDDPYTRKYELDLLKELKEQGKTRGILTISRTIDKELDTISDTQIYLQEHKETPVKEEQRVITDIIVAQLMAMFCSMDKNLKPDAPSTDGTINRVVKGVKIYDPDVYNKTGNFKIIAE